jgi:hypothetical protein
VLFNPNTGEATLFAGAPGGPGNGPGGTTQAILVSGPAAGNALSSAVANGTVREISIDPTLTYQEAVRRLEKLKEKVNCEKRRYSMVPGIGLPFVPLAPNAYDPRATTSDTVSADGKKALGGDASPWVPNQFPPSFLPGTDPGRSYLPEPPVPDAPWFKMPNVR